MSVILLFLVSSLVAVAPLAANGPEDYFHTGDRLKKSAGITGAFSSGA